MTLLDLACATTYGVLAVLVLTGLEHVLSARRRSR